MQRVELFELAQLGQLTLALELAQLHLGERVGKLVDLARHLVGPIFHAHRQKIVLRLELIKCQLGAMQRLAQTIQLVGELLAGPLVYHFAALRSVCNELISDGIGDFLGPVWTGVPGCHKQHPRFCHHVGTVVAKQRFAGFFDGLRRRSPAKSPAH